MSRRIYCRRTGADHVEIQRRAAPVLSGSHRKASCWRPWHRAALLQDGMATESWRSYWEGWANPSAGLG
jgi:hypothetical protein